MLARGAELILCEGAQETALMLRSAPRLPVAVLLPAVAAAWVSGLAPALLAAGIDTFDAQLTAEPH